MGARWFVVMATIACVLSAAVPASAKKRSIVKLQVGPFRIEGKRDREVCQAFRVKVPGDMQIDVSESRSRLSRGESVGSHHFVAYAYQGGDPDRFPVGKLIDSAGCGDFGPTDFFTNRVFLAGDGGQSPVKNWTVSRISMPSGLVQPLPRPRNGGDVVVVLNSHYFNYSDRAAKGVAKLTLRLSPRDPHKRAVRQITDIHASRAIMVPPGGTGEVFSTWQADGAVNESSEGGTNPSGDVCLWNVSPHMHKRGTRFVIEYEEDGAGATTIHETTDYIHPGVVLYSGRDPRSLPAYGLLRAHTAENGHPRLRYRCFYANGADGKEMKEGCEETEGVPPGRAWAEAGGDGLGSHATPCGVGGVNCTQGTGRCVPANLVFGPLSDDDMCVLTAMVYDPLPGVPPEEACNPAF